MSFNARNVLFPGLFLLCFAAQAPAFASGPGTTAANFLKIPVGARETSLGGAFTAVADNANAVFYNPAGLGQLEVPELSYAYNNYLSGVSQQWLAAAYPAARGTFGAALNYLSVAPFSSYDSSNNRTGSVSAYDLALFFGYGGRLETSSALVPSLRYGAALKYISEALDARSASGYGLDAGLLLLTRVKGLRLGLGLENLLSSRLDFIGSGAKPPLKLKAGASYLFDPADALLSLDLNSPEDGPGYLSAGIEKTLYGPLALRAGYSSFGDVSNGAAFGLGYALPARGGREMRLDYSYASSFDLGSIHKFALSCRFGAVPGPAPAPAQEEKAAELPPAVSVPAAAAGGPAPAEDVRSLAELQRGLADADPEARRLAAQGLGDRREAASIAPLLEAMKNEESETVKTAILEALNKLSAP